MSRYTITPWKQPSDLLTVRGQLYRLNDDSGSEDLRRHAVDRIMAWKLRSNLPHAVESTALLIDAQLHHHNAGPTISDFSIRAVYAAAFTRFVTGFCDIGRARERGLEQSSMLAIARQIGMPGEFVALRHEATHEELPGLRPLIAAVERGLEWLWGVYWAKVEEVGREGGGEEVKADVMGLLKTFRRERRNALRSRQKHGQELMERTTEDCLARCRTKRTAAAVIAEVLVRERLLLPTNRAIGESMDGAYLLWDDMLQHLTLRIPALSHTLVQELLSSITEPGATRQKDDTDKEAHALWVLHLTSTAFARDQMDSIMQHCCLHPGHWAQIIGRQLLKNGDDELREAWQDVLAASMLRDEAEGANVEQIQTATGDSMDMEETGEMREQWRKAALPPSLPIGVVR